MTDAAPEAVRGSPRPWAVLRQRGFRSLWAAHLLTTLGEAFSLVAMPWLVLQLTGSGLALGTVLALEAVPRAALMLVGGAVTDRLSPRLAMLGSAAVRAVLIGLLAALILFHTVQLWEIYAIALLTGTVSAFFIPARFSVLPSVVGEDELEAGNALLNLNQQGALFLGPAVAGLLVAATGPGPAFALDAVAFGLAALILPGVVIRQAPSAAGPPADGVSLLREIGDGLRYAWSDAGLRAAIVLSAAINFATAGAMSVGLPVLARERFAQGAAAFGIVLAAWGIGSTLGVVGAGLRAALAPFGLLIIAGVGMIGICLGLIGLAPTLPLAIAAAAAMGVAGGAVNTYAIAWLQRRTEGAMRGRVMSIVMLSAVGLAPISLALAGLFAGQPTLLFCAAAAIVLATTAGAALSRTVRQLR